RFAESYAVDIKFDLDAVIDGTVQNFPNLLDVIIKNTKVFGGEWVLDPASEADDGRFELVPIAGRRDLTAKLIAGLRHSPIGTAELEALGIESAAPVAGARMELAIRTGGGQLPAAQCDGEEIPAGDRYTVEVAPRALRLIVPREHLEPAL